MRWKFAFGQGSEDLFFVTTRRSSSASSPAAFRSKITTFLDEDEFLGHLIRAGLREEQTMLLARAVLLSVARPVSPPPWIEADVTPEQMQMLHLSGPPLGHEHAELPHGKDVYLQAARAGYLPQFYDLLVQAPTALSMLTGPDHQYSFLNERYAKLIGIKSVAKALGSSVLDRYAGAQRLRLSELLDRIYRTGESRVEIETPVAFFHEASGSFKEGHFSKVFQPILNAFGEVAGIMEQTTDVTEVVLERDVREQRERLLYRQWAELDAIYGSSPAAMMLIDAKDFRILRLNQRQAKLMGADVACLPGRPLLDMVEQTAELTGLLRRVLGGQSVKNHLVEGGPASARRPGLWLVNYAPIFSEDGRVEAIISIALEIPDASAAEPEAGIAKEPELAAR